MRVLLFIIVCGLGVATFAFFLRSEGKLLQRHMYGDGTFAQTMFARTVPYTQTLESYRYQKAVNQMDLCSVAVVELPPQAPEQPPKVYRGVAKELQFGGLWRKTPMFQIVDKGEWVLTLCGGQLENTTADVYEAVLKESGSFYINDLIGKRLQIYSPASAFAASFQFYPRRSLAPLTRPKPIAAADAP